MPIEYTRFWGTQNKKYVGFTSYKMGEVPAGCSLVIVSIDGDTELWIVDGNVGLKALREFYQDQWGKDRTIPFQEFSCTGIKKDMKSDKWFL